MRVLGIHSKRGVTLVEALVTMFLLSLTYMIGKMGVDVINTFARKRATLELQRQAQVALYQIAKDIRNAKAMSMINISATDPAFPTLELQMFDFTHGYDIEKNNMSIFEPANIGVVTYKYVTNATGTYLERTAKYDHSHLSNTVGIRRDQKKLLTNMLMTPSLEYPIFSPGSHGACTSRLPDPPTVFRNCHACVVTLAIKMPKSTSKNWNIGEGEFSVDYSSVVYTTDVLKSGLLN